MAIAKYSDDEIISILKDFYDKNHRLPSNSEYKKIEYLPSKTVVFKRFGNNASLISKIKNEVSDDEMDKYVVNSYTDEEVLYKVRFFTYEFIKENTHLPRRIDFTPVISPSILDRRFRTVENMYNLIGIDYRKTNEELLKADMLKKYNELYKTLGHTPSSKEVDKYSTVGKCYASKTYSVHFGSIYNVQLLVDSKPNRHGAYKSKVELLSDLQRITDELGRLPTYREIARCEYCCCTTVYDKTFGNLTNAFLEMGYRKKDIPNKNYRTPKGTLCTSTYEYNFALMLEQYEIQYDKEVLYNKYIKNFDKRYKFDFVVYLDDNIVFVEIFGIEGNSKYEIRKQEKIDLCKNNNIDLIEMYSSDFSNCNYSVLLENLKQKICQKAA